jgi:CheY-like chemotaxis protein
MIVYKASIKSVHRLHYVIMNENEDNTKFTDKEFTMSKKTKNQPVWVNSPIDEAVKHPRILIAEDDPEMRRLLMWRLRNAGFETVECADGWQLLDHLGNPVLSGEPDDYDMIVSDIRMPGVTGLEVLEGIHETEWFVPMILITAFGNEDVHRRARELGAAGMFDKPFDIDDLIKQIRKILFMDSDAGDNWSPRTPVETHLENIPIDIIFSQMPRLEYIENRVKEATSIFDPIRDKILYFRTVIVGPEESGSGRYHIQVMVTLANKVFVVRSNLKKMASEGDLYATIPTAFEVTLGKIQKFLEGGGASLN